jgi:HK97 family phage major capsid protein
MNRIHARDRRKWFAVHFGRSYFNSAPLAQPMLALGLAIPIAVAVILCAVFCMPHAAAGMILAISPIIASQDRINDLKRQLDTKETEYNVIKAKVVEEKRSMTDDERIKCTTLQKEMVAIKGDINLEEDEIEMRSVEIPTRRPIRPAVQTEDELQRLFPGLPPKEERFANLGELVTAVIQAEPRVGGKVDKRLARTATGIGENSPTDGGFLVQPDMSSRLVAPLFDKQNGDEVLSRLNTTPVTVGNGMTFNAIDETSRATTNWGGIVMYWLGEGDLKTPSAPKLRRVELKLKKLAGLCYLTDEMMEDAPSFSARLEEGFRVALRSALIRAIIRGTGAGQPLGLLNSSAKIAVAAETGQQAATIVPENIVKMFTSLDPNAVRPVWLYNRAAFQQIYLLQAQLGVAGALVNMPNGGIAVAPNQTLLGLPLIPVPWCSVLGTEGDLILTDLAQYELINKGGASVAYSIHVRFLYDETAMRIVYRCDGQPSVISPTTLEDGSSTVSPIVTLATRS